MKREWWLSADELARLRFAEALLAALRVAGAEPRKQAA